MYDPGIPTYQSIAPDVSADESLTPDECWVKCTHGDACLALLMRLHDAKRLTGEAVGIISAVEMMGCSMDCEHWEEAW